jgi:hypothetical protein
LFGLFSTTCCRHHIKINFDSLVILHLWTIRYALTRISADETKFGAKFSSVRSK